MSRLAGCFEALRATGKAALVPYITAGDPDADITVALMHALVGSGADVIELGVPFSDPMADGPTIQLACERALAAGMSLRGALACVARFRQDNQHTPVVLMGYLNPVESMGAEAFARAAEKAGVDGVLTVDLTVEETDSLAPALRAAGLDVVFLIAPTTQPERVAQVAQQGSGYLYYVSLKGVTGSAQLELAPVAERLAQIRTQTDLPIAVGFGIRDPQTARQVATVADAVVVGSALVELVGQGGDAQQICARVSQALSGLRAAIDEAGEEESAA